MFPNIIIHIIADYTGELDIGPLQYFDEYHPKTMELWFTKNVLMDMLGTQLVISTPSDSIVLMQDGPHLSITNDIGIDIRLNWIITNPAIHQYVFCYNGITIRSIDYSKSVTRQLNEIDALIRVVMKNDILRYHRHNIAIYRALSKHPNWKDCVAHIIDAVHIFHCHWQPDKKSEHRRTRRAIRKFLQF